MTQWRSIFALSVTVFLFSVPAFAAALTAPTLVDYGESNWTDTSNSPEVIGSVSWLAGDVVIIVGATENGTKFLYTPTVSGLTFSTTTSLNFNEVNGTGVFLWTATAGSGGSGSITLTLDTTGTGYRGASVFVYRGSTGIGTPATLENASAANAVKTISLNRVSDNSAVITILSDWDVSNTDVTVTSDPVGGTEREASRSAPAYTNFIFDWGDQGSAGTTAYGITNHTGNIQFSGLAVEVKGAESVSSGRIIRLRGGVRLKGGTRIGGTSSATGCAPGFFYIGGDQCRMYITSTSQTTFSVPAEWNNASNTVEVIGGGGGGEDTNGGGGGGGAYAKVSNINLNGTTSITVKVGAGGIASSGNGGDTFFLRYTGSATTCTAGQMAVCAKAGSGATDWPSANGGASGTSIGSTTRAGGDGGEGDVSEETGGGGGGAAGPLGDGLGNNGGFGAVGAGDDAGGGGGGNGGGTAGTNGNNANGGDGGNNVLGAGGGTANGQVGTAGGGGGGGCNGTGGGAGGDGVEWGAFGSGGGGGGGGFYTDCGGSTSPGGAGGLYGGGGGGGGESNSAGGAGGQGIIIITYKKP